MTKLLFLLSAVFIAVAVFLSYQNKQSYADSRGHALQTNAQIRDQLKALTVASKDVERVEGDIKAASDEVATSGERLNQAKIKLKNIGDALATTQHDIDDKNNHLKDLQVQFQDLFKKLPAGVGIENLPEIVNTLKTNNATSAKQAEDAAAATKVKLDELKKAQENYDETAKKIEERKKLYQRNSMTATIVAVNNDWGFVVINAGENMAISPDTRLLVTRGTQTIGKLNIVSVEGNRTVANIVQDSLRPGVRIAPGDHVILETLIQ